MGSKIDQKWAQGIRDNVNALILEIERLEGIVDRLEVFKLALEKILKQVDGRFDEDCLRVFDIGFRALGNLAPAATGQD